GGAPSSGRERDLGRGLPSARHLPLAQGDYGRDRQHRRGRPAGARRRARARGRGNARAYRRHGDAHGRGTRRARPGPAAVLHGRPSARLRDRAPCISRERSALADAALAPVSNNAGLEGRRSQQRIDRGLRRLDHRRAVFASLRRGGKELDPYRRLRLDADGKTGPPGRRRMPGGARALRAARGPLRSMTFAFDPRLTPARPDLAARSLEGKVKAARFVDGETREVVEPHVPLRRMASPDTPLDTEALMGERVT